MATPCSKNVCASGGDYWADNYPAKTPTQAYCPPDANSAVKSSTKLTLFDQSARKIGPPQTDANYHCIASPAISQRLVNNAKTPGSVQRQYQHSAAKRVAEPDCAKGEGVCHKVCKCHRVPLTECTGQLRRVSTNREAGILHQQQFHTRLQGIKHPDNSKGGLKDVKGSMPQPEKQQQLQQQEQEQLGRRDIYAAVRANKSTREEIGGNMALTPVRRSARKLRKSEIQNDEDTDAQNGQSVAGLLESTSFCYTPNKELTPLLFGQEVECSKAHRTEGKQLRF
eukprot:1146333-Pelagomonas_calceolata.AAC.1